MPYNLGRKSFAHGTSPRRWRVALGLSLLGCVTTGLYLAMPSLKAQQHNRQAQSSSSQATTAAKFDALPPTAPQSDVQLCQALGPAAPYPIRSVDCADGNCGTGWKKTNEFGWQYYAQGEYVGHQRIQHVPEYRLRVDDKIDLIFRVTRDETSRPYQLNVGDEIRVESFTDQGLNRDLIVQPDGTITLRLLGQIAPPATRSHNCATSWKTCTSNTTKFLRSR